MNQITEVGLPDCPFCGRQMVMFERRRMYAVGCFSSGVCWYALMGVDYEYEVQDDGFAKKLFKGGDIFQFASVTEALRAAMRRAQDDR